MFFRTSFIKSKRRKNRIGKHPKIYTTNYKRPKVQTSFFSFKKFFIYSFLVILIGGLIYFVFLAGFFEVKNIILLNNRFLTQKEVESVLDSILRKKFFNFEFNNILFINSKTAENLLVQNYPNLSSVKITKKLPNTLQVEVSEREGVIVWDSGDGKYLVDEQGVVFSEYSGENNLPKVVDSKKLPVELNSRIIMDNFVSFVLDLVGKLPRETNIVIDSIIIPESTYDIWIKTKEGFDIYFDVTRSLNAQLGKLKILLKEIEDEINNLEYIDLRIKDKVFYK